MNLEGKMEKKKIIWLAVGGLVFTIIGFLIFLDFSKKAEISTDIEGLYSSFTDYMKTSVDPRLKWLGCEPEQYSDNGSTVCFMCDDVDACFGYGWVDRESMGMKMNLRGLPYLINNINVGGLKIKFVDFCHDGLASELECKKGNDLNRLECEQIDFINESRGNEISCDRVKMKLREEIDFKDFAQYFCKTKGEKILGTAGSYVACGEENQCGEDIDSSPCEGEGCQEKLRSLLNCAKHIIFQEEEEIKILF